MPSCDGLAARAGFARATSEVPTASMCSSTATVSPGRLGRRRNAANRGHSESSKYSPTTIIQVGHNNGDDNQHQTLPWAESLADDRSDLDALFPGFSRCSDRSSSIASTVSTFMRIRAPTASRAIYDSQESLSIGSAATSDTQSDNDVVAFREVDYTHPAPRRADSIQYDPLDTSETAMNHLNATAADGTQEANRPGLAPAPLVVRKAKSPRSFRATSQEKKSASPSPHDPRDRLESVCSSQPLVRRSSQPSHQAAVELAIHSPSSSMQTNYSFDSESCECKEEPIPDSSPVGPRIQDRDGKASILRRAYRAVKQKGIAPAWKRARKLARRRAN